MERDKSVNNSVIKMSPADKNPDEAEFKKEYKKIIREFLPPRWEDYKVDEFIEALFKGLEYDPKSEFGQAINHIIYKMHKKWLFVPFPVYDNGIRRTGVKYFPNSVIKPKTEEKVQEQYQKL